MSRKILLKPFDEVRVFWIDAGGEGGWSEGPREDLIPKIVQVGIVVAVVEKGLFLAQGYNPDRSFEKQWLGQSFIPAGCIEKVEVIRRGQTTRARD